MQKMKTIAYLPVALIVCLLLFSYEVAARGEQDFIMTLKLRDKTWDPTQKLVADVIIKNTGRKDLYIGYKCDFGFQGNLVRNLNAFEAIRYEITWDKSSKNCSPQRDDFIKIPPGRKASITLTSLEVKRLGSLPGDEHPKGWYTLFVRYGTSKIAPFDGVFLGTSNTNKVRLLVK